MKLTETDPKDKLEFVAAKPNDYYTEQFSGTRFTPRDESCDGFRREWFKKNQKNAFIGIFVWVFLSAFMLALSFFPSDGLILNVRFLSFMSGIYLAFSFNFFTTWAENRAEEKARRKTEAEFYARMKAKEAILSELIKDKCYTDEAPG